MKLKSTIFNIACVLAISIGLLSQTEQTVTSVDGTNQLSGVQGESALVTGQYESGLFVFNSADLSIKVAADPDGGLYVPPSTDTTGASGAWVRVVDDATYRAEWWLKGDSTLVQDKINRAIKLMPIGSKLRLPPRRMTFDRAAHGSVVGASAGPPTAPNPHNGILNAIYVDKPGITIEGCGYDTHLDGEGRSVSLIGIRESHCKVSKLRAGNVKGQLYLYESAAVIIHPSHFIQGSGTGHDIEDFTIEDCDFYACDSGVSSTAETDLQLQNQPGHPPNTTYFRANGLNVINCRIEYRRQGVELWCRDSMVCGNRMSGLDKGAYEISRGVRNIGGERVAITGNLFKGFSDDANGYMGIVLETSGLHHNPPNYEFAYDCIITGNRFENFTQGVSIESSRGQVHITDNLFYNEHDSNSHFGVRLNANGVVNEYGSDTDWNNKCLVDQIVIENNQFLGQSNCFYSNGTILFGRLSNNKFVGNAATDTSLAVILNTGVNSLESVDHFEIVGNVAVMNPSASGSGTIRFSGLKPNDYIVVDDNRLTPCEGAIGIIDFDSGNGAHISARDKFSNIMLPSSLWSRRFNPPRLPISGTYPPIGTP